MPALCSTYAVRFLTLESTAFDMTETLIHERHMACVKCMQHEAGLQHNANLSQQNDTTNNLTLQHGMPSVGGENCDDLQCIRDPPADACICTNWDECQIKGHCFISAGA